MTASEYRAMLAAFSLSHTEAANLLGITSRSSRRWAEGTRDVSEPAARFLRFLMAARIPPSRVIKLIGEGEAS